jgi:hypothetical protein
MKKINTKKAVLWSAVVVMGILVVVDVIGGPRICGVANLVCRTNLEEIFTLLYSIPVFFLLSLITYRMKEEVFRAWWNFARWWVPVIIVATLLLNSANSGGGMGIGGAVSGAFDILFLLILYAVLVATSLVKIVRAYNKK